MSWPITLYLILVRQVMVDRLTILLSLSSTGLHVFPTFVIYELTVLVFLTLSVVIMKV